MISGLEHPLQDHPLQVQLARRLVEAKVENQLRYLLSAYP